MALDLSKVRSAFDALPLASDPIFRRVAAERKLRHTGPEGVPDLVDELSARLMCSALRSSTSDATLVVFPDGLERRAPLLFATALVMDGLAQIESGEVGRCVLYVSGYAGIRSHLASIRLGSFTLDGVFAQQYGRRRGNELKTVSSPGGVNLPSVFCICAPADPAALLRQYKAKWVAVDCGESHEIGWLPGLLAEAKKMSIPVVGWTARPFSGAVAQWLEVGAGVFRWPRLQRGASTCILALEQLAERALEAEVTARVLLGEHVIEISKAFASATEAMLAAREFQNGRLSRDAVILGWKCLRAMESVPVPLAVYEREVNSYWGLRRISELRENFARFMDAVRPHSPSLHAVLQDAADALASAHDLLGSSGSPLWLGLANLCVESTEQRRIVFASKSRREMFALCLLARFNISEDDLRDVGVELAYLKELTEVDVDTLGEQPRGQHAANNPSPLLVGMPSRFAERHLDGLLDSGQLEVLLWPHQEPILERRIRHLSSKLSLSSRNLGHWLPILDEPEQRTLEPPTSARRALRLGGRHSATAGALGEELRRKAETVSLWKRPDAAEAIADLFGTAPPVEDDEGYVPQAVLPEAAAGSETWASPENPWVQEALEIWLEGGLHVLLPTDETVNVIVRVQGSAQIEERYVRSLRVGDEILLISGQRRQSLYELLVSRVHRDPVIAQYLALVRRWQDDFVRAFTEAERLGRTTPEGLLQDLQAKGSRLTSPHTVRSWSRRLVLAPSDPEDLKRIAEVLSLGFVKSYCRQINTAAKRLRGLHISLAARLNRWLTSSGAGTVAVGTADEVIDVELGLTVEDFRHSLLRARVLEVRQQSGPFYRPHLGRLEGGRS
ncbi:MAG: hypothetical protein AB1576_10960 [Bacillota bacterium]